jgi:hypothetical protein
MIFDSSFWVTLSFHTVCRCRRPLKSAAAEPGAVRLAGQVQEPKLETDMRPSGCRLQIKKVEQSLENLHT